MLVFACYHICGLLQSERCAGVDFPTGSHGKSDPENHCSCANKTLTTSRYFSPLYHTCVLSHLCISNKKDAQGAVSLLRVRMEKISPGTHLLMWLKTHKFCFCQRSIILACHHTCLLSYWLRKCFLIFVKCNVQGFCVLCSIFP